MTDSLAHTETSL